MPAHLPTSADKPAASPAAAGNSKAAPSASTQSASHPNDIESQDDDEEEEGDGDEGAEGAEGAPDASAQGSSLTAKQRKKKKSKAAAKLRKKLGLAPSNTPELTQGQAIEKQIASGSASAEGKISDDVVKQVQKAVQQEHGDQAASRVNRANLAKVMAMMNLERDAMLKGQDARAKTHKTIADHKFWKTQPVMKPDDKPVLEQGAIQPNCPPDHVRAEPYPLPNDFEWVMVDVDDAVQLKEVYDLLSANYVEDDDASLRFNYSPEFLLWVLKHPGYRKTWHIGVRVTSTRKLVAFISGIPHELRVRDQFFQSTEINFLCVHKKLRSKRLAPVLIKEVTRQCNLTGVFQAIYTVGSVLPTPVSCSRYYHRTINARKLVDVGFSAVPHNMSLEAHVKRYELPAKPNVAGMREMETKDLPAVAKLLRRYMRRFDMAPRFNDEEVEHVLLSGKGVDKDGKRERQVTWTYVVEDPETHRITDMISFYSLPSSILDHEVHKDLNAAYLFYYATDAAFADKAASAGASTSAGDASGSTGSLSALAKAKTEGVPEWQQSTFTNLKSAELKDEEKVTRWDQEPKETKARIKKRLNELCNDVLIFARDLGFDVVNCLTVMDNPLFLQEQKFGPGDGFLRFYLFNWRVQPVAGGMGARPGESELDPVVQYMKSTMKAGDEANRAIAEELVRRSGISPAEIGSGNGVVMV